MPWTGAAPSGSRLRAVVRISNANLAHPQPPLNTPHRDIRPPPPETYVRRSPGSTRRSVTQPPAPVPRHLPHHLRCPPLPTLPRPPPGCIPAKPQVGGPKCLPAPDRPPLSRPRPPPRGHSFPAHITRVGPRCCPKACGDMCPLWIAWGPGHVSPTTPGPQFAALLPSPHGRCPGLLPMALPAKPQVRRMRDRKRDRWGVDARPHARPVAVEREPLGGGGSATGSGPPRYFR